MGFTLLTTGFGLKYMGFLFPKLGVFRLFGSEILSQRKPTYVLDKFKEKR